MTHTQTDHETTGQRLREGVAQEQVEYVTEKARELANMLDTFAHCDDCVIEWAEYVAEHDHLIESFGSLVATARGWTRDF